MWVLMGYVNYTALCVGTNVLPVICAGLMLLAFTCQSTNQEWVWPAQAQKRS